MTCGRVSCCVCSVLKMRLLSHHKDQQLLSLSKRRMFRLGFSLRNAAAAVPISVFMTWAKPHMFCMDSDPSPLSHGRRVRQKTSDPSSPAKVPKPSGVPGHMCQICQQDIGSCFCPRAVKQFTAHPNAYFTDASGVRVFWPRLFKTDAGGLKFGCAVCMQHNAGVQFVAKNVISRGMMDVKAGKLSKTTLLT